MKEIKFRGKVKEDFDNGYYKYKKGEWVYGYYIFGLESSVMSFHEAFIFVGHACIGEHGKDCVKVELETVGQWTLLKDKNGKEIYDGDIVKAPFDYNGDFGSEQCTVEIFEVKWLNPIDAYQFLYYGVPDMEVIGNIHENKELLGEE